MASLLDKLRGKAADQVVPAFTPGARAYCIGDIHGRADLLDLLHVKILADSAEFAGPRKVVYLGDYIDRGPDSKQVIDLLLDKPLPGFEQVFILGNHEKALLDFLEFPDRAASWLSFGGLATLLSYGIVLDHIPTTADLVELSVQLQRALPESHRAFFNDCVPLHREGSYCFVHAGIRPGIPLERQHIDDLLWIREEFTRSGTPHEAIVVHGHTITTEAELQPNRIGIDTGAYFSDILTCLVLEGGGQRLLQTGPRQVEAAATGDE